MRLAVGIVTVGRPRILADALATLARQTRMPDAVVVCHTDDADLLDDRSAMPGAIFVRAERGICRQRNVILDRCRSFDVVVFLDDDFVPAPDFLAEVETCFERHPAVVAACGRVLADGINGLGIAMGDAFRILEARAGAGRSDEIRETYNAYGCNMAIRLAAVERARLRFDAALPLYGWLEDVDFCRRLAGFGRIVQCEAMIGVHRGAKTGRTSGLRLGYAQVANPIYLCRKGTLEPRRALAQMARNVASNLARAPRPEPWCDRRGRLRGNVRALADLLRRRLDPRRVERL